MPARSFRDSWWNTTVSSMRLMSSGRMCFLSSLRTCAWIISSGSPFSLISMMAWLPMFDVITMMALVKSTVRPCPSVRRPSSSTCSSTLLTSGCAFSNSSKSTTQYGRRRTASVRRPPSS